MSNSQIELEDRARLAESDAQDAHTRFRDYALSSLGWCALTGIGVWTYGPWALLSACVPVLAAVLAAAAYNARAEALEAKDAARAALGRFVAEQREEMIERQQIARYLDRQQQASNDGVPPEAAE